MTHPETDQPFAKPPRVGPLARIVRAAGYSMDGLTVAWRGEAAFRQEVVLALVLLPLSMWLGRTWLERAVLAFCVLNVLAFELANSAVEAIVDKASPEVHPLAKRAKDLGSAAVFMALIICGWVWALAILDRWVF